MHPVLALRPGLRRDAQYHLRHQLRAARLRDPIATFFDRPMPETTCVFCGQCVGVCPTGALKPKRQWLLEQGLTADEISQTTRTERRRKARRDKSTKEATL